MTGPAVPPPFDAPAEPAQDAGSDWAAACHFAALSGYVVPFGNLLGPLVVWLWKRKAFPSVNRNGKEALNFQVSLLLYAVALVLAMLLALGGLMLLGGAGAGALRESIGKTAAAALSGGAVALLLVPMLAAVLLAVLSLVFTILAGVRAAQSRPYSYPLTIRFLK